jgi:hypothetical protein
MAGTKANVDILRPLYQYGDLTGENECLQEVFLLSKDSDLVLCRCCRVVYKMAGTIANLRTSHLTTKDHCKALDPLAVRAADDIADRVKQAVGLACFEAAPFNLAESPRRARRPVSSFRGSFSRSSTTRIAGSSVRTC